MGSSPSVFNGVQRFFGRCWSGLQAGLLAAPQVRAAHRVWAVNRVRDTPPIGRTARAGHAPSHRARAPGTYSTPAHALTTSAASAAEPRLLTRQEVSLHYPLLGLSVLCWVGWPPPPMPPLAEPSSWPPVGRTHAHTIQNLLQVGVPSQCAGGLFYMCQEGISVLNRLLPLAMK